MTDLDYQTLRATLDDRGWADDVLPDDEIDRLVRHLAGQVRYLGRGTRATDDEPWEDTFHKIGALDHAISALVRARHLLGIRKAAVEAWGVDWDTQLRDIACLRIELDRRAPKTGAA